MELSMEVLKSFAALTKDDPPKQEITLWGTAMVEAGETAQEGEEQQNLVTYVLLDGATDPTPVNQVAAVGNGDRVMVQIKNHKATIVGNASHPPDESKDIAEEALTIANKKIVKIETEYCLATSRVIPEGSTFKDIQVTLWDIELPEYVAGNFYWARQVTYWSDETITYGDPYFDMTDQVAAEAKVTASTAKTTADEADRIAKGTTSHFWFDEHGAHIGEVANDLTSGASQTVSSTGTIMRLDGKIVTSWTMTQAGNAALNFYNGSHDAAASGDLMASYNSNGIILYVNAKPSISITASGILFTNPDDAATSENPHKQALFGPSGIVLYKPDGTTIAAQIDTNGMKIINGSIVIGNGYNAAGGAYLGSNGLSVSNKFVVDSNGILNCSGATVSGVLTAGNGSKIGNFTIANGALTYEVQTSAGVKSAVLAPDSLILCNASATVDISVGSNGGNALLFNVKDTNGTFDQELQLDRNSLRVPLSTDFTIRTANALVEFKGGEYSFKANEFGIDDASRVGPFTLYVKNSYGSIGIYTNQSRGLYDFTNSCWLVCSSNNKDLVIGSAGITNAVHIRNALTYVRLGYETNCFYPNSDNETMLGTSNHRWASIYVKDTTVHGSDAKDKDVLGDINFANELIMSLKPCAYMWKDGDHRRKRLGFIAQETAETCKRIGENLALVTASYSSESKSKVDYFGEEVDDSELIWGISYKELIAPMVAVIQRQELRIKKLENELETIRKGA